VGGARQGKHIDSDVKILSLGLTLVMTGQREEVRRAGLKYVCQRDGVALVAEARVIRIKNAREAGHLSIAHTNGAG